MLQAPTPTTAGNRGGRPRRVLDPQQQVPTSPAPAVTPPTTASRVLRLRHVLDRVGLSRAYVYAMAARGEFPAPLKLGPRAAGWLESEVDAWVTARAAERHA